MTEDDIHKQGAALIERNEIAIVGTVNDNGYPEMRAMTRVKHDGMRELWFSTNTSSRKIPQVRATNKGSVYFVDCDNYYGLLLIGRMEVLQDSASRRMVWQDGFEKYFPGGVDDPDHSVLHFTAERAEFFHGLKISRFDID